jgi:hypothetical protein
MSTFLSGIFLGAAGTLLTFLCLGFAYPTPIPKPTNEWLGAMPCHLDLDTKSDHVHASVLVIQYSYEDDGGVPECIYEAFVTPKQEKKR